MENNTDRELKDKLQSLDFPFDPKAWEQMESKLEENRKRGEKVPNTQTLKSFSESNPRFPGKRNIVVDSPG